jgi:hypothetical protein
LWLTGARKEAKPTEVRPNKAAYQARPCQASGRSLLLPEYIDRDFHSRNRSSVLKPVCAACNFFNSRFPLTNFTQLSLWSERFPRTDDSNDIAFFRMSYHQEATRVGYSCDAERRQL